MGILSGVNIDMGDISKGIGAIGTLAKDLRAAIFGKAVLDPTEQAKVEKAIIEIESTVVASQSKVNEMEAQHASLFVAGWRPYIGWILGTAIGVYFLPIFVLGTYLWGHQVLTTGTWVAPPDLGIGQVIALVGSMLGLATLRSFEKKAGVNSKH